MGHLVNKSKSAIELTEEKPHAEVPSYYQKEGDWINLTGKELY